MNKISIHLDLTNDRERIMFEYIKRFDEMFEYINHIDANRGDGVDDMPHEIDQLVRDYNTKMPRNGGRKN